MNEYSNIMFLEKFVVIINLLGIEIIDLESLYEKINNIKKRDDFPTILSNQNTEKEQLKLQILKMEEIDELIKLTNGSYYISILHYRREEILGSLKLSERNNYFNLATLYIDENIEKTKKRK